MRQLKISNQVTNRDNISITIYLHEIGKIDMLTANEEAELAGLISEGDRNAFEKMVKANLRFVVSVSKQYQNQGLSLSDLINEGNLGLLKAAERFDKNRGFKFISYAVWWIRQSILQAIAENSRAVRLPLNKIGLKNKILKAYNQLSHEFLREPTITELSVSLDIQSEIVEEVINMLNVKISMDAPIGNEDQINLYDLILNVDSPNPESHLIEDSFRKEIERSLTVLSNRDSAIVRSYYGLDSSEPLSLREIALNYGLSPERVRQIKDSAIKKLRAKNHSKNILKEYTCI